MIDRIGKGGAPPPVTGTQGTPAAEKTGKTFEVGNAQEASKTQQATPVGAVEPSPLDQLKAGKIDFDGYLDFESERGDDASSRSRAFANRFDSIDAA